MLPATWDGAWDDACNALREGSGVADFPADYLAGLNYVINEQPDRALEVFTRMVDVNTETVEIHFALGSLFRAPVARWIAPFGSTREFSTAHSSSPSNASKQLLELAIDYLRARLLDRSESLYLKLAESRPHRLAALRALIGIYEQQHDWQQAISVHRQLRSRRRALCRRVRSPTTTVSSPSRAGTSGQFERKRDVCCAKRVASSAAFHARRSCARSLRATRGMMLAPRASCLIDSRARARVATRSPAAPARLRASAADTASR